MFPLWNLKSLFKDPMSFVYFAIPVLVLESEALTNVGHHPKDWKRFWNLATNCKNHDFTIHDATFKMMYLGQSDNGLGTTLFNKLKQLKKEPIKKTLGERCLVTSFPNFAVHIGLSPIEQGENREDFHYRFNLLRSCILRPFVLNKK